MTEKLKVRPDIPDCGTACNKQGWCLVKDVPFECMCGHLNRVGAGMPLYIKHAPVIHGHAHHLLGEKGLPIVPLAPLMDANGSKKGPRLLRNLFISSSWSDMKSMVRILLMAEIGGHVSVVDEQELLAAYVGSMGKAAKSADYSGLIYNNISELVGPPNLVIIRLNTLSNKNKAAAGVLIDAVKTRVDYGKPTWLLCDIDRPFNQASFSYSDELIEIVATNFKRVSVPRINKRDSDVAQDFLAGIAPAVFLEPDPAQQEAPKRRGPKIGHDPEAEPERRPRRKQEPEDETVGNLGSVYGVGVSQSKTKFRK